MQIGTVDAFQGREFDVVLMSTVRCNNLGGDIRKRVGFLDSPKDFCVAFSRAKRLLLLSGTRRPLREAKNIQVSMR